MGSDKLKIKLFRHLTLVNKLIIPFQEIYFNGDMFDLDSYDNEIGYIRTHNNDDDMLTREYLETSMTHTVPTEGMLYQPEELNINGVLILYPQ